jgi:hypothetical protein
MQGGEGEILLRFCLVRQAWRYLFEIKVCCSFSQVLQGTEISGVGRCEI